MLTPLIDVYRSYYEVSEQYPNSWRNWIEFVTATYPVIYIGNDGVLYLVEGGDQWIA